MKTGVLTFPNSPSYGATLQMYALCKTVADMGHEVEAINYYNAYMKAEKHVVDNKKDKAFLKNYVKTKVSGLMHMQLAKNFRDFEKENIPLFPCEPFSDKSKFAEFGKRYDAVICGSDQVWNPLITDEDMSYFLDFCTEKTRRISYAPSFGLSKLSEDFSKKVGSELESFHAISVREASGKDIVSSVTDRQAALVLDPTLLVDKTDWNKIEKKHPAAEGDYIAYYTARSSATLMKKCMEFSEKTGMKVVVIGGNRIKKLKNKNPMLDYAVDASPEQWLYIINHARYVFTNSFHGTAFSVIYRKDFFVEYPDFAVSRLVQILSSLGLEERAVNDREVLTSEPILYENIENRIAELTEYSRKFLREALS